MSSSPGKSSSLVPARNRRPAAALKAGASGFLLKNAPTAKLLDAVRTVAAGDALLAPSITRRLVAEFVRRPPPGQALPPEVERLTERKDGSEVIYATFRLADGRLRLAAPNHGGFRVHTRTCTATIYGGGTWTVIGGTGSYAGATGGGRLTAGGTVFAQRSPTGACRAEKTREDQAVFYRTMELRGTLTLPSS